MKNIYIYLTILGVIMGLVLYSVYISKQPTYSLLLSMNNNELDKRKSSRLVFLSGFQNIEACREVKKRLSDYEDIQKLEGLKHSLYSKDPYYFFRYGQMRCINMATGEEARDE